jgi:glutathione gamma-glutamylcysteinyltransferase
LECCAPLVDVKQKGITLVDFECLARCNGCTSVTTYAEQGTDEEYQALRAAVVDVCTAPSDRPEQFIPAKHLILSYSRKALHQTGSGHFSPVAAWDPDTESVLVRDLRMFDTIVF